MTGTIRYLTNLASFTCLKNCKALKKVTFSKPQFPSFRLTWALSCQPPRLHIPLHSLLFPGIKFFLHRMRCYKVRYFHSCSSIALYYFDSYANFFDVCVVISTLTIFAFQRFHLIPTLTLHFRRISFIHFDDNATFSTYSLFFNTHTLCFLL